MNYSKLRFGVFLATAVAFLSGCSKTPSVNSIINSSVETSSVVESASNNTSEFLIDNLDNSLVAIAKDFDSKTKYLTKDELQQKKDSLYKDICTKYKLSYKSDITIRGKALYDESGNLCIVSQKTYSEYLDEDSNASDSDYFYNKILTLNLEESDTRYIFIEQGDNIVIKGLFNIDCIKNCKIISPNISVPKFNYNIENYNYRSVTDDSFSLVYGKVKNIHQLTKNFIKKNLDDGASIYEAASSSKYLVLLADSSGNEMYWFANQNLSDVKVGDKICIQSDVVGPLQYDPYEGTVFLWDSMFNKHPHKNYYIY